MSKPTPRTLDLGPRLSCLIGAAAATLCLALVLPLRVNLGLSVLLALALVTNMRSGALPKLLSIPLTLGAAAGVMIEFGVGFGGGFGRDTGAALLAVMLLLKLTEMRSLRDGRAVACFSLFALLAAFLQDRGPLVLSVALVASLLVLSALARLAEAEDPGHTSSSRLDLSPRLKTAARLAAFSIPLALVGFLLFPRLANPLWALPKNSDQARSGLSDSMSPGDISELFLDDTPILRVRFAGPVPPSPQLYWRGPVLTNFDGREWSLSFWSVSLPPEPFETLGPDISYETEQEPTDRRFVFALDVPGAAPENLLLTYDRSLLTARRPLTSVSRHSLRSQTRYRFEPDLKQTLRRDFVNLPSGFNPRTQQLADQWRSEGADNQAMISRALALFNAEFTYTLTPPLLARDSVDDFLFNTKAGYCEHFASSFAVLMRAADIPARVVTGYQGGYVNPLGDYLVVRQSDAHAWTEVWLDGQGWVRIDPTSAVAPERIDRGLDALGADRRAGRGWGRPLFNAIDWLRRGWNETLLGFDATRQSELLRPLGVDRADWRQLAIAMVVCATLALAVTLLMMLRPPKDSRDALARAWSTFLLRLAKAGLKKAPSETAQRFAGRAALRFPASAAAIRSLSQRYTLCRYAQGHSDPQVELELANELRSFRITAENRS